MMQNEINRGFKIAFFITITSMKLCIKKILCTIEFSFNICVVAYILDKME